jgi:hypothetical protein
VNLNVNFTPSERKPQGSPLPEHLSEELIGQQDRLLAWLKDPRNRVAFVTDPVTALQKAGVKLPAGAAEALRRRRDRPGADGFLPPGVELTGFTASVKESTTAGAGTRAKRRR